MTGVSEMVYALLASGETGEALAQLDVALAQSPDDALYRLRAQVRARADQLTGALADLDALAQHDMSDHLLRLRLLNETGHTDDALRLLLRLHDAHPDDVRLCELLYDQYMLGEDHAAAAALAAQRSQDWRWKQREADARVAAGEAAEALALYGQALAHIESRYHEWPAPLLTARVQLLLAMSESLIALCQCERALTHLEAARQLSDDPAIGFHIGRVRWLMGQQAEGCALMAQALARCGPAMWTVLEPLHPERLR